MYAALHSRVKVEDLLKGVMIQSANDGCIALAEGIAGNEASFVRMMNDRARELGLTKSTFTNVDGLPDPKMRVTPRELAMVARHIVDTYPDYYKWFGEREFTWNKIRQQNRNPLLGTVEGADGMKTGFTNEAGYNLVGSAVQNGVRLIVVVTGLKNAKDRADEAKKLLEYGFQNFDSRILFAEGQTVAEAKVYGGAQGKVPVTAKAADQADGAAQRQREHRRRRWSISDRSGRRCAKGSRSATCRSGAATPRCSKCRCRPPKALPVGLDRRNAPSMPRRNL